MKYNLIRHILLLGLMNPFLSFAEWKKLQCVHENGFTAYIDFDQQKQIARVSEYLIVPALINDQSIFFIAKFPDGISWMHSINRTSGILTIKRDSDDSILIKSHQCKPFDTRERKF